MKSKTKYLNRTIRRLDLHYTLFTTEENFHAELKRLGVPPQNFLGSRNAHATTMFLHSEGTEHMALVTISPKHVDEPLEEVYGLLVHEAVHIVQEHYKLIGEKEPADEDEAYTIQAVSAELMLEYRRQMDEIDNKPLPTVPKKKSKGTKGKSAK